MGKRHGESWHHRGSDLPVACLVNDRFWETMDYRKYSLTDKSSSYFDETARTFAKWAKPLQVQMKLQVFDSLDLIFILSFLSAFEMGFDTNAV